MSERDPALDKAWREHSRETPPPALDAAILAAAHRAVDSRPRAATGAPRWWMPLMAAAVVGVVAIGVIQLAPPPPPALDTASSSVVASVEPKRVESAQQPAAAPPVDAPKAVAEPEAPAKKQKETADTDVVATAPASRARVGGMAGTQPVQETPLPPIAARTPPPLPAAQEAPRENKLAAERRPEPFPASPAQLKTEATDDKRRSVVGGRDAASAADALTPGAKRDSFSEEARKDTANERQLAAAAPPSAAAAPAAAPAPAPARPEQSMRAMEADRGRAQASGMLQKNAAPALPLESAKEKARDPDAWIARIRKLRDDGQAAEGLRELREFRDNVPDADKRLPPDLRDWKL